MMMVQGEGARYIVEHRRTPDNQSMGLWTFSIQERDVSFWGRYPEAESTARQYAVKKGLNSDAIRFVDGASFQFKNPGN